MSKSVNGPIDLQGSIPKYVWYESNAALKVGQAVCYHWDYTGDGEGEAEASRYNRVETPDTSNAQHFAGVSAHAYSAKSGGQLIEIYVPGSICKVLLGSATDTVIGVGLLTFDVTSDYEGQFRYEGLDGEGSAQPLQTITNDGSTATCLVKLQEGPPSGGVEVVACDTPGPTCMVGGSSLITGGNPGGASAITLADGTITGLRKKFVQITPELTTTDIVITVSTGMRQDGTALQTVTYTHGQTNLDMEVVLEWRGGSWCVTGLSDGEPDLA